MPFTFTSAAAVADAVAGGAGSTTRTPCGPSAAQTLLSWFALSIRMRRQVPETGSNVFTNKDAVCGFESPAETGLLTLSEEAEADVEEDWRLAWRASRFLMEWCEYVVVILVYHKASKVSIALVSTIEIKASSS